MKVFPEIEGALKAGTFLKDFLGGFVVIPESRMGDFPVQGRDFPVQGIDVKDTPGAGRYGGVSRCSLFCNLRES